jgi:hypothetical protein
MVMLMQLFPSLRYVTFENDFKTIRFASKISKSVIWTNVSREESYWSLPLIGVGNSSACSVSNPCTDVIFDSGAGVTVIPADAFVAVASDCSNFASLPVIQLRVSKDVVFVLNPASYAKKIGGVCVSNIVASSSSLPMLKKYGRRKKRSQSTTTIVLGPSLFESQYVVLDTKAVAIGL